MDYDKHLLTLRFCDPHLEAEFQKTNQEKSLTQSRLAVILGMVLYLGFIFLDYNLSPGYFSRTMPIRLAVSLFFLGCWAMTYRTPARINAITTLALVSGQIGHFLLMMLGNVPVDYGYGVTVIILVFMFTFSRIAFINAVILSFVFIGLYEAVIIFYLNYNFLTVLNNNYILISVNFASILAGYTIDLFTRNDFIKSLILEAERKKSDNLLLNILPETVANELKEKGTTTPVRYSLVTVLFVDFVGFTRISANLSPDKLIQELSENFCYFDTITRIFSLEKIKTIGDSYMLAGGIPQSNDTHHFDCLLAALRIKKYLNYFKSKRTAEGLPAWDFRMGINTGPLIAGVIGEMKFAYDIFGDTVNVASRMESHGEIGEINVSQSTYELIADYFDCEYRGKIDLKGRGLADMYLVKGIRSEFAADSRRFEPNEAFLRRTGCRFNLEPAVNYDTTKI